MVLDIVPVKPLAVAFALAGSCGSDLVLPTFCWHLAHWPWQPCWPAFRRRQPLCTNPCSFVTLFCAALLCSTVLCAAVWCAAVLCVAVLCAAVLCNSVRPQAAARKLLQREKYPLSADPDNPGCYLYRATSGDNIDVIARDLGVSASGLRDLNSKNIDDFSRLNGRFISICNIGSEQTAVEWIFLGTTAAGQQTATVRTSSSTSCMWLCHQPEQHRRLIRLIPGFASVDRLLLILGAQWKSQHPCGMRVTHSSQHRPAPASDRTQQLHASFYRITLSAQFNNFLAAVLLSCYLSPCRPFQD